MKNIAIFLTLVYFVFSCNQAKKGDYIPTAQQKKLQAHPGKALMETNCYVCHSPSASEQNRIGPPMIAIKHHYKNTNTTKTDFIASLQAWIKNPNLDDAKMVEAVKRFGLMPKTSYPEETIYQIADYMFDYDIAQPKGYKNQFNEKPYNSNEKETVQTGSITQDQSDFQALPYGERGLKYALSTKVVLGKNLMGTIQKKGSLEALSFCNENAYPLTDSMSVVHNATIKRVSDKPRNDKNQANTEELKYIEVFKQTIAAQKEPKPIVKELDHTVSVFYPITTNTMCLQCHGTPNQTIAKRTLDTINILYPRDKAIGYDVDQVRGIWHVTFKK